MPKPKQAAVTLRILSDMSMTLYVELLIQGPASTPEGDSSGCDPSLHLDS